MAELIFVVEDDEGIQDLYECAFIGAGFELMSFVCAEDMFAKLKEISPSIIILDIMLPKIDGITALKMLKKDTQTKNIPVILVSAKSEESTKVKGLVAGADDYITKPFGVMELIARINNTIARSKTPAQKITQYCYKDLVLDTKKHSVCVAGNNIDLTPKEFDIVKMLLNRVGEVVTRNEIFDCIWGEDFYFETRTLDIHINSIRKKLAQYSDCNYIETVRGVGYIVGDERKH